MTGLKTLINGLKTWVSTRKIDEKQIPESIARVKGIPRDGSGGSNILKIRSAPDGVLMNMSFSELNTLLNNQDLDSVVLFTQDFPSQFYKLCGLVCLEDRRYYDVPNVMVCFQDDTSTYTYYILPDDTIVTADPNGR